MENMEEGKDAPMKITIVASDENNNYIELTRDVNSAHEARSFADNVYNIIDSTPNEGRVKVSDVYDTLPSDVEPSLEFEESNSTYADGMYG
jgi:hypothetical protein